MTAKWFEKRADSQERFSAAALMEKLEAPTDDSTEGQ
jgi:hypothetical protein